MEINPKGHVAQTGGVPDWHAKAQFVLLDPFKGLNSRPREPRFDADLGQLTSVRLANAEAGRIGLRLSSARKGTASCCSFGLLDSLTRSRCAAAYVFGPGGEDGT